MRAAATPVPLDRRRAQPSGRHLRHRRRLSGTFNISTAAALVAAAAGHRSPSTATAPSPRSPVQPMSSKPSASPSASHPDEGAAALAHASLRLPARLQPAPGHESGHAGPPRPRHPDDLSPRRPALQPRRSPRPGHGRLLPAPRPPRRRIHAPARRPPRLRRPRRHQPRTRLGTVHGTGLDELSISGPSHFAEVRGGTVTLWTSRPSSSASLRAPISSLRGGDAAANAASSAPSSPASPAPAATSSCSTPPPSSSPPAPRPDLAAGIDLAARAIDRGAVTGLIAELARRKP